MILAFMSHFDKIMKLPEGFVIVASTQNSEFAGIAHQTKPIYGQPKQPQSDASREVADMSPRRAIPP